MRWPYPDRPAVINRARIGAARVAAADRAWVTEPGMDSHSRTRQASVSSGFSSLKKLLGAPSFLCSW
ncbi:hypothetical protein Airi02_003980 [Actinoallomurus iriomotensis]|uniref:Uncharacterized protein n=1 Tax=Actinoallomurus iriomotensis TaxID=478107 RepID=A0A9W6RTU4_9ACTN|nr:hypothetical protein Airi02_003980 [Actinoallomurus iriomotensis]